MTPFFIPTALAAIQRGRILSINKNQSVLLLPKGPKGKVLRQVPKGGTASPFFILNSGIQIRIGHSPCLGSQAIPLKKDPPKGGSGASLPPLSCEAVPPKESLRRSPCVPPKESPAFLIFKIIQIRIQILTLA